MQTSEVLQIAVGTAIAVVDPFSENRKQYEDGVRTTRPNRVKFGKRVNDHRYTSHTSTGRSHSQDIGDFVLTSERNFGFLMEFDSGNGSYYAVVKPRNVISTREEYEAFWIPELARLEQ